MLKTSHLTFAYPESSVLEFPDLESKPGSPMLILGESGSGKTTLLHLLGGLLTPRTGSIEIAGQDISNLSGRRLDRFRGQNIGLVFQRSHFVESLTVKENLELAAYLPAANVHANRAMALLQDLGIEHKAGKDTGSLSVGEQQRAAIARAMMNQPDVILADEPTSALDDKHCESVLNMLRHAAEVAGATLVVVTHDYRLKDQFDHQITLA